MLSRLNRWQLRVKTILSLFSKLTWLLKQLNNFFVKLGQSRVLFLYFCLFNTVLIQLTVKKLPMTGFELRICGVGSNRSANFPTTRSLMNLLYVRLWTMCNFMEILSRYCVEHISILAIAYLDNGYSFHITTIILGTRVLEY